MAITLEELKQQREQIRKHLEWLDAKIAEQSPESQTAETAEAAQAIEPPATQPPLPDGAQLYEPPASEDTAEAATTEAAKPTNPVIGPDPDAPQYKAKTQGEVMRAKVGCLVLFILSTALFLFLLFGLPYLL